MTPLSEVWRGQPLRRLLAKSLLLSLSLAGADVAGGTQLCAWFRCRFRSICRCGLDFGDSRSAPEAAFPATYPLVLTDISLKPEALRFPEPDPRRQRPPLRRCRQTDGIRRPSAGERFRRSKIGSAYLATGLAGNAGRAGCGIPQGEVLLRRDPSRFFFFFCP